jgi:hypothetical protein
MAVITVYARHSSKCPKSKEKNTGQWKRCKCPLWLQWNKNGNQFKKSAKTRSWDVATKAARKLEDELEQEVLGVEPIKKPDHITIEAAVDLYLSDMTQRALAKPTIDKARRMLTRLRDYANARGIILLKDVTARLLTEWRSTWKFKAKSSSPAVHWAVSKTFSKWAFRTDLIEADPSSKLKSLPSEHNQVQPLTQGEMKRLLAATDNCEFSPEVAYRVKTVMLLMRWSGLACMDATTLRRDAPYAYLVHFLRESYRDAQCESLVLQPGGDVKIIYVRILRGESFFKLLGDSEIKSNRGKTNHSATNSE